MSQSFRESRMRTASLALALTFVLAGLARTAYADPHAMFYTVTGQQQLFFNVLAALDQADYVEPQTERNRLLETRAGAGIGKETDPGLVSTETKQAGLLARGITLEGQDLWTTYQKFQLALEAARRKDMAALLTYFCQRALGVKDCQEGSEPEKYVIARKEGAYNLAPGDPQRAANLAGLDALLDGTPLDQEKRKKLLQGTWYDPTNDKDYNPHIANFYAQAGSDETRSRYLANLVAGASSLTFGKPSVSVFNNLVQGPNGVEAPSSTTADAFIGQLSTMLSLPNEFLEARILAQNRRLAVENELTVDGAKADTFPVPKEENGQIGAITGAVSVPAYLKAAQGKQLVAGATDLAGNPIYADPIENIPGQDPLVERDAQQGTVNGISISSTLNKGGQVAGITDEEKERPPEEGDPLPTPTPQPPLNNPAPIRSLDERPIFRILEQLSGGSNRGGCKENCSIEGLVNSRGMTLLPN